MFSMRAIATAIALPILISTAIADSEFIEFDYEAVEAIAISALDELQPESIAKKREFCGYVLWHNGRVFSSEIVEGDLDSCQPPETPEGTVALASFHTHGNHDPEYESEVPSPDDVEGDFEEETLGFVGTPGGRVWLIDPDQEEIFLICDEGCIAVDPDYDEADYGYEIPDGFTPESHAEYFAE